MEEPEVLAMMVADVLGDLESEEVMKSQLGVDGETRDTQRFAFNTRADEEPPVEVQVEQLVEVKQVEVEPDAVPSMVEEDVVEVVSPPRGQTITSPPESSFRIPTVTQSSPGSTTRFYERFVVKADHRPLLGFARGSPLFCGASRCTSRANCVLRPRLRK